MMNKLNISNENIIINIKYAKDAPYKLYAATSLLDITRDTIHVIKYI